MLGRDLQAILERIEALPPEGRARLREKVLAEGIDLDELKILPRSRRPGDPMPLSFAQTRLWYLHKLHPGSFDYNTQEAARLTGELDRPALVRALSRVVERHESLRTRFELSEGGPVQIVQPSIELPSSVIDLSSLPSDARARERRRIVRREMRIPFDLETDPLLRMRLIVEEPQSHVLLLTLHHIVTDAWSINVLLRETAALYAEESGGPEADLPELPIQYADFAAWERDRMSGRALEEKLGYWTERLGDGAIPLGLPLDRPRSSEPGAESGTVRFHLGTRLSDRIRRFSREHGTTTFVTLAAVFDVFLHRLTGVRRITVGTPVANRSRSEIEGLVGFFVNTLVLRTDVSPAQSFLGLLETVREEVLEAQGRQDVPFEKIVEAVAPRRDVGETPLFQVMLAHQSVPREKVAAGGLSLIPVQVDLPASFDLMIALQEEGADFVGAASYLTDRLDETTVRRWTRSFRNLLAAALDAPSRSVGELPWLTRSARHQVTVEWDAPSPWAGASSTLPERFAARVRRAPDAVAVCGPSEVLTYGELDRRAGRLAAALRTRGAGPETLVGLLVERSADLVVGIVGILRSGGAYVPIDRDAPAERIRYVLSDAGVELVVHGGGWDEELGAEGIELLPIDRFRQGGAAPAAPAPGTVAETAAYVIYTSGSTGRPKGTVVTHRNAVRLFDATAPRLGFGPDDTWSLFHSCAFDFSVWELWGALLHGGRVAVVPHWDSRDPERFHRLLRDQRVTVLSQTPSAFRQLVAADGRAPGERSLPDLRLVCFGGEALEPSTVEPWLARYGDRRPLLVNMYGITETTVHVTWETVLATEWVPSVRSTVGRALPDLRLELLDARGLPVPIGVVGEIHVGGEGPARGYLSRPGLTAERFVPDAFSERPGARLYRSGDLARRLQDGRLEFLGRVDDQVKIRGFRVEPGESAAVLARHPDVEEAVVLAGEGPTGDTRLVGYAAVREEGAVTPEELRSFLGDRVPSYMVPAAFVLLDRMPLTPNGKLDRKALPAPERTRPVSEPPKTLVEATIAGIWEEVLGVEPIGVHDNFFELGGDSILATQVVARVRRAGLDVDLEHLIRHQTVAGLAAVAGDRAPVVAEQGPMIGELPLTPVQLRLFELPLTDPHHFNQSLLFDLVELPGHPVLEQAIRRLLEHHDALRLGFRQTEDGWVQRAAAPPNRAPFHQVDLRGLPAARRDAAMAEAAERVQAGFDLARPPLFRALLFRTAPGGKPDRLLLLAHHLVIDGVSWRIVVEDLDHLLRTGATAELPPKTSSYRRWAEHLVERARSPEARSVAEQWTGGRFEEAGALPVDRRGARTEAAAETILVQLDPVTTRRLVREMPERHRARIDEVLLAALADRGRAWTGGAPLLVDLEAHGREPFSKDLDVTRTVGWFTSIFPVLLDLGDEDDPVEILKRTKETLRSVSHGGVDFGVLRHRGPEDLAEKLRALPTAPVIFNYLGHTDRVLARGSALLPVVGDAGEESSPRNPRHHELEINAVVFHDRLRLRWTFGGERLEPGTVRRWADEHLASVRRIVELEEGSVAAGFVPSDFPEAELSQDELDSFLTQLES